ncbi:MAG TPA: hypothetical protein VH477_11725 [Bryobacteraceae bacterium]|jgi:hypothetical protein
MGENDSGSNYERTPVPAGFRSGVITAITVVLGFSFLFLRSWAFELPGEWTASGALAAVLLLVSVGLQLTSLWRSLQLKDEHALEYRRTLRWFLASILVLLVSLVTAALSYSELIKF